MNSLFEMLMSRVKRLLDRLDGRLHFRLVIMPLVVTFLALLARTTEKRSIRSAR